MSVEDRIPYRVVASGVEGVFIRDEPGWTKPSLVVDKERSRRRLRERTRQHHSLVAALTGSTRESVASSNWAGGVASPPDGDSMASVRAEWHVPTISLPPDPPPGLTWSAYSWVGLDNLDGLLQIGAGQWFDEAGHSTCVLWFEWLAPASGSDPPYLSFTHIQGVSISPGDRLRCTVEYLADGGRNFAGSLTLENFANGEKFGLCILPPPNAAMSGSLAEWIVEGPVVGALARFTTVDFKQASATTRAGVAVLPSSAAMWNIYDSSWTNALTATTLPEEGDEVEDFVRVRFWANCPPINIKCPIVTLQIASRLSRRLVRRLRAAMG